MHQKLQNSGALLWTPKSNEDTEEMGPQFIETAMLSWGRVLSLTLHVLGDLVYARVGPKHFGKPLNWFAVRELKLSYQDTGMYVCSCTQQ